MKARIKDTFKFAHMGYDVREYSEGDEVDADSDVGKYALDAGLAEKVSAKRNKNAGAAPENKAAEASEG